MRRSAASPRRASASCFSPAAAAHRTSKPPGSTTSSRARPSPCARRRSRTSTDWRPFPVADFDPADPDASKLPEVSAWLAKQVAPTFHIWLSGLQALGRPPAAPGGLERRARRSQEDRPVEQRADNRGERARCWSLRGGNLRARLNTGQARLRHREGRRSRLRRRPCRIDPHKGSAGVCPCPPDKAGGGRHVAPDRTIASARATAGIASSTHTQTGVPSSDDSAAVVAGTVCRVVVRSTVVVVAIVSVVASVASAGAVVVTAVVVSAAPPDWVCGWRRVNRDRRPRAARSAGRARR